ncbi:MAG: DUF5320 family protein [Desulfobacterales bacterium]|nr:DUF5320 family protein [Desulfobacterales bacterium]
MPRGDGTGPMGYGRGTGRGGSFCTDRRGPDDVNQMQGRGFGQGFGRCRGFGGGMGLGRRARRGDFFVEPIPKEERSFLENNRERLQGQLNVINKRLEELAAQESGEK